MSELEARPISGPATPRGIGGWLLFFVLTMVVFGPAIYIVLFFTSYGHTMEGFARSSHPYANYLFYAVEQLADIAVRGYGIFAGIQLWKIRPTALMHAKRFLLLVALYHLADFAVAVNFRWILDPPGTLGRYLPQALLRQSRNLVYPVVWYAYLLNSKRVHNTFCSQIGPPAMPTSGR
jgi:hypothetical protein